jgi:hypothetical protein
MTPPPRRDPDVVPEVVPAFTSVSYKQQAAFVFNEGSGGDAVGQ